MQTKRPILVVALTAVLLAGALYSHYLTGLVSADAHANLACSANGVFDCAKNLTSSYGKVFGIPVSAFAVGLFVFLLINTLAKISRRQRADASELFALPLLVGSAAGLVAVYYLAVSILVLHSLCLYCTVLYGLIALTIGISYFGFYGDGAKKRWGHTGAGGPPRGAGAEGTRSLAGANVSQDGLRNDDVGAGLGFLSLSRPGPRAGPPAKKRLRLHAIVAPLPLRVPSLVLAAAVAWVSAGLPAAQTPGVAIALPPLSDSQPISIVEFGDFECPACKSAGLELEALKRDHPGKLTLQFVNYPLCHDCNPDVKGNLHKNACLAAKIGIVMKSRGKFDDYCHKVFSGTAPLDESQLFQIVSELGESESDVRQAAQREETAEVLRRDIEQGQRNGVQATPTLMINGKVAQGGGANVIAQLKTALNTGVQFADVVVPAQPGFGPGASVASRAALPSAVVTPGPSADLFSNPYYVCSRNFYVSASGSDSNDGSAAHPWLTLQHADSAAGGRIAGDCVNVAPGTYAHGVQPTHGGNLASSTGYVVYRCQTLDGCKITATGGFADPAFTLDVSGTGPNYFIIDGFELAAASKQVYGVGVMAADSAAPGSASIPTMHHLWVLNCVIHGFGQAGINPGGTDYQYYIHNKIYDNAGVTCDAQGSGISIVVPKGFAVTPTADDKTNPNPRIGSFVNGSDFFHNVIEWNIVYNNALTTCGTVSNAYDTDGNNIILDTFNTWNGNSVTYPYQSLVAMNLVYNAGGGGIHIFSSNDVTVANNTCYNNYIDPANNGSARGCIDSAASYSNTYINNISVAIVPSYTSCAYGTAPYAMWNSAILGSPLSGFPADTFSHNITYMIGSKPGCNGEVAMFGADTYSATLNKKNTNPLWTNVGTTSVGTETTPPVGADFTLQAGSPAIGYALPQGYLPGIKDAGAYQTGSAPPPPPLPTASLSASPASIVSGSSSTLSWSSTNATSCTGTGFNTGNATSGSVTVSPTATTVYSVKCTNVSGSATANATITVTPKSIPVITSGPLAAPNPALVGQLVAFSVAATNADGSALTYAWNFGDGATGTGSSVTHAYSAAGTFAAAVTVSSAEGTTTTGAVIVTVNNNPVNNGTVVAINSGGAGAGAFSADADFSAGRTYKTSQSVNTSGVTHPAPQAVYQSERYGNFTYTIPGLTAGAAYTVRLHFAEIYWNATGKRVFNVAINGQAALANFDIFAATGGRFIAIVEEFAATANANGQIVIVYTTVKDNAKSSGIEIVTPGSAIGAAATADTPLASVDLGTVTTGHRFKLQLDTPDAGKNVKLRWKAADRRKLPPGVIASGSGFIGGKPKKIGTYVFELTINAKSNSVRNSYTLTVR